MAKQTFSANQVICMVFDTPAIAGDREDEFEGYVDDEEISTVSAEHHFFSLEARNTEAFSSKLPKQLDCCVCSDKKKRKCISYCCEKCDVALFVVPCFELYHTKVDPRSYIHT